jgi:aryl-alcohol dehydrogenase-like predicted oxidoreductase
MRALGRTGERVSVIGMGGYHLGVPADANAAVAMIRRAIDAGITFMDCAWDYHQGESERRLGLALGRLGRLWWLWSRRPWMGRLGRLVVKPLT